MEKKKRGEELKEWTGEHSRKIKEGKHEELKICNG